MTWKSRYTKYRAKPKCYNVLVSMCRVFLIGPNIECTVEQPPSYRLWMLAHFHANIGLLRVSPALSCRVSLAPRRESKLLAVTRALDLCANYISAHSGIKLQRMASGVSRDVTSFCYCFFTGPQVLRPGGPNSAGGERRWHEPNSL